METKFIPIDYNYFDFQGENYVRIIGRNEHGQKICILDKFESHFWAILKDKISDKKIKEIIEKIKKIEIESQIRNTKVEKVELHNKNFLGKKVKALKIFVTNYKDAHAVAEKLDFPEIEFRREYDIPVITKYILEKKIAPLKEYKIKGNLTDLAGANNISEICILADKIEEIKDSKTEFTPKILAYDIEADELEIGKGEILMISLVSDKTKKVLTWKKNSDKLDFVEHFKNEEEMLKKFIEYVKKEDPDILVGYFSDGFDLPYLRARCEKNKIKLSLGIDGSQPIFSRGKISKGYISGIVHLDLFRFIETIYSQYLQSETLGLNDVANELLGEGKKDFEFKKSHKIKDEEWKSFYEYNLHDSVLTLNLTKKLWKDIEEFTLILQEPIFDITRDGLSQIVESYILHNLEKFNEIAEKRPIHGEIENRRDKKSVEGAFVFQPKPGLYEDIAFFDFTSMHTSIIISFNISKGTLLNKKEKNSYESPELDFDEKKTKFYFSKEPGFFPLIVKDIFEKRKRYKKEYKENPNPITKARSNAFKLLSASIHGYVGFFGARYYSLESSASILAFVRKLNKEIIEKVSKEGYSVIYGDTDSIAFTIGKKNKKQVLELLKKINSELPGIMELELEDFYKRGLFVSKRTTEVGAKKKYALINEKNEMKIRGFETVRRDWCDLSRNLQSKVIELILKNGNEESALQLVKKTIKDLKERKVNKKDILIRTQLKKPIEEYKSITPHVIAAKKIKERQEPINIGMLLEYFIAETNSKSKLIRDKVKLSDENGDYDKDYYLKHQILPSIENIFEVFKIDINEAIEGKRQMTLGEF
ncbi:MAG: DNA-directed DNA polymerase [Candidatus Pacearchaeota archaeon]|jgi:DNA polymerase I/DNA polymerase-2